MQRARGQLLHYHAEQYLNGCAIEEPHSPEFRQVMRICEEVISQWEVFRTEVCLYHRGLNLAGQADLLCRDSEGKVVVWDWKRSRELRFDNPFRSMKPPLEHLPDCSWCIYCLQLNLYTRMLEDDGFKVSRMILGVVHPNRSCAQCIEVPRMQDEIDLVAEHEAAAGRACQIARVEN